MDYDWQKLLNVLNVFQMRFLGSNTVYTVETQLCELAPVKILNLRQMQVSILFFILKKEYPDL